MLRTWKLVYLPAIALTCKTMQHYDKLYIHLSWDHGEESSTSHELVSHHRLSTQLNGTDTWGIHNNGIWFTCIYWAIVCDYSTNQWATTFVHNHSVNQWTIILFI